MTRFVLYSSLVCTIILINPINSGYIGVSQAKSQPNANDYCLATYGTTLASIHSNAENNAVYDACTSTGITECWIGRYCPSYIALCDSGSWTKGWDWYDGTSEFYGNFQGGSEDPANRGMVIQAAGHSGTDGAWDDHDEDSSEYFVCNTTPEPTKNPTKNPTPMPTTSMPTTSMPTTSMPTTSMPTTSMP
eukprot:529485_1